MAGIPILQANLQHSKTASGVLQRILTEGKIKIALIQEPWAFQGRVRGLNVAMGKLLFCTTVERPRTCIYVNGLNAVHLSEFTTRDQTAALLTLGGGEDGRRVVICSSYLPYDSPDPPPSAELERLVRHCNSKRWDLLIGCDANSHHTV